MDAIVASKFIGVIRCFEFTLLGGGLFVPGFGFHVIACIGIKVDSSIIRCLSF